MKMFDNENVTTVEQLLARWDAGKVVWTVSMGGLGPGYEQCIHVIAMEILRAVVANPPNWKKVDSEPVVARKYWDRYTDKVEKKPAVKEVLDRLQPSGAQVGAAWNVATVYLRNGYEAGFNMAPTERHIQVSKDFPR